MPTHYSGETWPDYYSSGFGQSRDSDALERSNFAVACQSIASASTLHDDPPRIVREGHFLVGWVEWLAIHQDDESALAEAEALCERYNNYPILDEEHFCNLEQKEAEETWRNCYSPQERVKYIREHRSQFEFHDYADMIDCVRGNCFAGYASDLIS
jgi:hypothetical protein